MKKLSKKQREIEEIQEQLEGVSKNTVLDKGNKTSQLLDKLGIKSPSLKGMRKVTDNTWIVPNTKLNTPEEVDKWKQEMINKFKL